MMKYQKGAPSHLITFLTLTFSLASAKEQSNMAIVVQHSAALEHIAAMALQFPTAHYW